MAEQKIVEKARKILVDELGYRVLMEFILFQETEITMVWLPEFYPRKGLLQIPEIQFPCLWGAVLPYTPFCRKHHIIQGEIWRILFPECL